MKHLLILFPLILLLAGCAAEERPTPSPAASSPVVAPGLSTGSCAPVPADAPSIRAASAILIDASTGRTLYEKNADEPRQVASTQKLVTALVVAESDPLESPVRVSREDTSVEPTRIGLRAGESYPRRQLLRAMLVHSANDLSLIHI